MLLLQGTVLSSLHWERGSQPTAPCSSPISLQEHFRAAKPARRVSLGSQGHRGIAEHTHSWAGMPLLTLLPIPPGCHPAHPHPCWPPSPPVCTGMARQDGHFPRAKTLGHSSSGSWPGTPLWALNKHLLNELARHAQDWQGYTWAQPKGHTFIRRRCSCCVHTLVMHKKKKKSVHKNKHAHTLQLADLCPGT